VLVAVVLALLAEMLSQLQMLVVEVTGLLHL
jgi:hypothetical protein